MSKLLSVGTKKYCVWGIPARIRVIHAVECLAMSETSVTYIALSVGYNSFSGFNAAFRDRTDMTPTQYRASFSI